MTRVWYVALALFAAQATLEEPSTETVLQMAYIAKSHPSVPEIVHLFTDAVYSQMLWKHSIDQMYFKQDPSEVRTVAEPVIYNMRARAYPTTEYKDITFVASERCENTTPDNMPCQTSPFTKSLKLETNVFDGRGYKIDLNKTLPVEFTVGASRKTFEFRWDHSIPASTARTDVYTFKVPARTLVLPPRTNYIIEYEMRRTLVEGHLLLDTTVGTPLSEEFFWAIETCAHMGNATTCSPVRYGDFYAKQVRHELSKGAKNHLCGTHDPRFCAAALGEDDKLHLMSKASFSAGVDATFKVRIWEESMEGQSDRLLSVIEIDPIIS